MHLRDEVREEAQHQARLDAFLLTNQESFLEVVELVFRNREHDFVNHLLVQDVA